MQDVDFLILGAGWTATFLIPLLSHHKITLAATTRDGRDVANHNTIKWTFNPDGEQSASEKSQFSQLPTAKTLLITFPLTSPSQTHLLVNGYTTSHNLSSSSIQIIQLGSTGIWQIPQSSTWVSRSSPYDKSNKRATAEDALLSLSGSVLNLAGLHGGPRDARNWVSRVAKTKDEVKNKKSVHLIHGVDVARAIVAVSQNWNKAKGQRWMLTDGVVYDWWELFAGWAEGAEPDEDVNRTPSEQAQWVYELMWEEDAKALPRSMETLGRCYDSREFWHTFGLAPLKARI